MYWEWIEPVNTTGPIPISEMLAASQVEILGEMKFHISLRSSAFLWSLMLLSKVYSGAWVELLQQKS